MTNYFVDDANKFSVPLQFITKIVGKIVVFQFIKPDALREESAMF